MPSLKHKDLLSIQELTSSEVWDILELAKKLKKSRYKPLLTGKSLAIIFEKPSIRTRVSFEVAMVQLGGKAIDLDPISIRFSGNESTEDISKTLSRYVDGIVVRTFAHDKLEHISKIASVPVINGLTDSYHPCQALADVFTVWEKKAKKGSRVFEGLKFAYIGDGNNVCNSLLSTCAKVGLDFWAACPKGYEPNSQTVKLGLFDAGQNCSQIILTDDPAAAAKDADVIYTDVWTSMGQEDETEKRKNIFKPFQVNKVLVKKAKPDVIVMHCLPAHRGEEITSDVIDGPNSVVFDETENRLHVQKAILVKLLK